jgi:hypothetical protein
MAFFIDLKDMEDNPVLVNLELVNFIEEYEGEELKITFSNGKHTMFRGTLSLIRAEIQK